MASPERTRVSHSAREMYSLLTEQTTARPVFAASDAIVECNGTVLKSCSLTSDNGLSKTATRAGVCATMARPTAAKMVRGRKLGFFVFRLRCGATAAGGSRPGESPVERNG